MCISIKEYSEPEETFLNIIKAVYDKPTVSIILNSEKAFPLNSGTRQGWLHIASHDAYSHSIRNLSDRNPTKGIKLLLFADAVCVCV